MKTEHIFLLAITTILFSCTKMNFNNMVSRADSPIATTQSSTDMEVATKENGILTCTVDEDILKAAVSGYYGGLAVQKIWVKEYLENKPNNFFVMEGRLKSGGTTIQYAFELIPISSNGITLLYLPFVGTEQRVTSLQGASGKLRLTSASTGFMNPGSTSSSYSKSTSTSSSDTDGTNGLILEIYANS